MLRCESSHSFDQAKQGYFNLLLNQDKKSKTPGDTAEMVQARKHFLECGFYTPIVNKCEDLLSHLLKSNCGTQDSIFHYTDIACGEGYYTESFYSFLSQQTNQVALTAVDISTPAIKSAAKRIANQAWLVGNAFRLPISDSSQDLVSHLFSRPCPSEARRILKTGGALIDVSAGPAHLIELREKLYDKIKHKTELSAESVYGDAFTLLEQACIKFEVTLTTSQQIENLITMTPHTWKAPREKIAAICESQELSLTCDININVFQTT